MKNFSKSDYLLIAFSSVIASVFFVVVIVSGATTIGTNITTTGTASSTSATTTNYLYVGSDITELDGWNFAGGDLIVSGAAHFAAKATTTTAFAVGAGTINTLDMTGGDLYVQGDAEIDGLATTTTSINTQGTLHAGGNADIDGTLKIGSGGDAITDVQFGICNMASVTITASTTAYANCTGATGVQPGDNVFVMATSGFPTQMIVQAASSSFADIIGLRVYHLGFGDSSLVSGTKTLFWQSMR